MQLALLGCKSTVGFELVVHIQWTCVAEFACLPSELSGSEKYTAVVGELRKVSNHELRGDAMQCVEGSWST
jgi:hypothetical protein